MARGPHGYHGGAVAFANEHFHPPTPVNIPIRGFGNGQRLRIVGVPAATAQGFFVNLGAHGSDVAFHFNPRFNERSVVRNNMKGGRWQREESYADGFPFHQGKIFTLEFVAQPGILQVYHNGELFTQFPEREAPNAISRVEIGGDVHVHSIHVSS